LVETVINPEEFRKISDLINY